MKYIILTFTYPLQSINPRSISQALATATITDAMSDPSDAFANAVLRQRMAGLCMAIGWQSAHNSAMDVLMDFARQHVWQLAGQMRRRADLCGRVQVNVKDAELAMEKAGHDPLDLAEFAADFQSVSADSKHVPTFPAPSPLRLNHLKPGSQEVLHRKMHVYDHLPAMYPEMEEPVREGMTGEGGESSSDGVSATPIKAEMSHEVANGAAMGSATSGQGKGGEAMPVREISSVMMTAQGFISPAREGRLPDSHRPAAAREEVSDTHAGFLSVMILMNT